MKRKIIAIASGDWHIHKFRDFDEDGSRLKWAIKAAKYILQKAADNRVPLLFTGDMFHDPKEVENETLSSLCRTLNEYKEVPIWAISGNHDMSEKNTLNHRSPTYLDSLSLLCSNIINLDFSHITNKEKTLCVSGLPYMNSDKNLIQAIKDFKPLLKKGLRVLLLHGNPSNCTTSTGFKVESEFPENIDSLFKSWDLVLWGHIHKPQPIGKKGYMLGSPIQQNFGDMSIDMGFWYIYEDGSVQFKSMNKDFPCFVRDTEIGLQDAEMEGLIKSIDYVENIKESTEEQIIQKGVFDVSKSRDKLAKLYCKKKGIKDKSKLKALVEILNQAGE